MVDITDITEGVKERDMPVSDFVTLLCDRMDNHPEEFYQTRWAVNTYARNPRWSEFNTLIESVKSSWNAKERKLIAVRLREIRMKEAHERLMRLIMGGK